MNENQELPPFPSQIEALLGVYWQAGYDEGTGHHPEVDPDETLSRIRQEVHAYARALLAATPAQAQQADTTAILSVKVAHWRLRAEAAEQALAATPAPAPDNSEELKPLNGMSKQDALEWVRNLQSAAPAPETTPAPKENNQ